MGFDIDSAGSVRNNRGLLKNRRKFKPNQTSGYKLYKHDKVSQGIGTHYRNYKKTYVGFIFDLLILLVNVIIVIFIVVKFIVLCLKHLSV